MSPDHGSKWSVCVLKLPAKSGTVAYTCSQEREPHRTKQHFLALGLGSKNIGHLSWRSECSLWTHTVRRENWVPQAVLTSMSYGTCMHTRQMEFLRFTLEMVSTVWSYHGVHCIDRSGLQLTEIHLPSAFASQLPPPISLTAHLKGNW